MVASARKVTRWAVRDTWSVACTRSWDVLLLLSAIAVAYLLRGATRHEVIGSLRDALWFLVALAFFLVFVFAAKVWTAIRTLRSRWKGFVTGSPANPTLHFEPVGRSSFPVAAARCQLACEEGSRYEWEWHDLAAWNHGLGPMARFPATFIPAPDGDGPGGEYRAEWCWKEMPSDGWIRGWRGRFEYDPVHCR